MKKSLYSIAVVLLTISLVACAPSQDKTDTTKKKEKIDNLLSLYVDYDMFHGSILVVDQGDVLYKNAFGLANMEWDIPNTVDTKFQIASMTKSFTALIILQLVTENKLALHEPISTYVTDYPKKNGDLITIHHLLTHAAGIGRDNSDNKKYNRTADMVQQFADAPLQFTPGDRFRYSNSGYTLLGYIIEIITGKTYEKVLQERIFEPLHMENSGFYKHRPLIKKIAQGYYRNFGEYYDNDSSDETTSHAAGAIYSTIEDLLLWNQAMNTEKLLPKRYMDLLFEKHIIDEDAHYGYGWELRDKPIGNTSKMVATRGHSGSIGSFRSLYTNIPDRNAAIIILNNTTHSFRTSITTAITGILYEQPYDLPYIPLATFMARTIENEGIDAGIQFYKAHQNDPAYHVNEQDLIVEGYQLLHAGNATDASKIFKLSTEVFPERDNPYDSYAEALMTLGNNEEAIINYKKSLALNPKNTNAIEMLKKLGITYSSDLLQTKDGWGKEIITFPIDWAPKMTIKGYEDLRFAPEWSTENHEQFWSLVMAWKVITTTELSLDELHINLAGYFDGLMTPNHWAKEFAKPNLEFSAPIKTAKGTKFKGTMTLFDGFHTGKIITLNILGEQQQCKTTGTYSIVFRFSPKKLNHKVWKDLNDFKYIKD